jgi:hypothetical protein
MSKLDQLPADLLNRLDQALPLFTDAAIRGEFWNGVVGLSVSAVLTLIFGAMLVVFAKEVEKREAEKRGYDGPMMLSLICAALALGSGITAVEKLPPVFAPDAVLARELLVGLRK